MFWKRSIEVLAVLVLCFLVMGTVASAANGRFGSRSSLENTMMTFQESIEKLIAENKSLAEANDGLRAKIKAMQERVKALKRDEARLLAQMSNVETHNQKRAESLVGLQSTLANSEQVLSGLQNERLAVEVDLRSIESEAGQLQRQVEVLQKEMLGFASVSDPDSDLGSHLRALQNEQSSLEGELAEVRSRVETLNKEWQNLSAMAGSSGAQVKASEQEQSVLKKNLEDKRNVLNDLRQQTSDQDRLLEQLSEEENATILLAREQGEVAALDLEFQTLQNIVILLEKRISLLHQGGDYEKPRRKKKEELLKDLATRNESLKSELSRSQQRMVELDKRKASLEKMLYEPKY